MNLEGGKGGRNAVSGNYSPAKKKKRPPDCWIALVDFLETHKTSELMKRPTVPLS
jgi:hypothetical protein